MNLYRLSELTFTSPYFSAMDCILNGERKCAIYCSTEITSGLSVYKTMQEHKVHTIAELDGSDTNIYKNVKKANERTARSFAASVRAKQSNGTIVINPAPLHIPDWKQPEYLAFWDELIRTFVKEVRFNENWEFSNGCTYEFAVALDQDITTLDSTGNDLSAEKAIDAIEAALHSLEDWGFSEEPKAKTLQDNYRALQRILRAKQSKVSISLTPDSKQAGKRSAKPSKR